MAIQQEDYEELDQEELEDRGDNFDPDEEDEDQEDEDEDSEGGEETDESDEEEEEVDEEEEETPKKEPRIPKSRLDEVIQQREDAKERNLWLEEQLSILIKQSQKEAPKEKEQEVPVSTYDFEKAEENYVSLIIEGEIAQASKLRAEIDKERKNELLNLIKTVETNVTTKSKAEANQVIEEERFNKYIDSVESQYSFLNDKHDDYNEEAVDTVNTLLAGYVAAGKSKVEGLRLAVSKVVPMYVKEEPAKKSLGNKRTVEAGKKAAKAASSQPTKVKSANTLPSDASTISISKMSDRDFAKLTEKEKRILRGD